MTRTPAPVLKHLLLLRSRPVSLLLLWVNGWMWTSANVRRAYLNFRSGPRRKGGGKVSAPSRQQGHTRPDRHRRLKIPEEARTEKLARALLLPWFARSKPLEEPLGKSIYRGLLKTVARIWKPEQRPHRCGKFPGQRHSLSHLRATGAGAGGAIRTHRDAARGARWIGDDLDRGGRNGIVQADLLIS